MLNRIRSYINTAFTDVPKTKKSIELQEELIANLMEKFNDQLAQGQNEDEAYTAVIANIGDLSELTESLREHHVLSPENPVERKKIALRISIAVMLYILSPMALIFSAEVLQQEILGLLLMFIFIAGATGILIYNAASKPRYLKEEESMIEEFKEFKAAKNKDKAWLESISSALWLITVAIYFYLSFMTGSWAFSWIIFIIAAAVQNIIKAVITMRHSNEK
ncbi:MAG: permease prefix domain 1-containing protein [Eubacteriales bacterium]|nr:permease prefix domain 1-containing protein [Eubacteriales bacterium]